MGEKITIEEIESVIEEKVRPQLKMHSGDILIEEFSENRLKVRLTGECSNCPAAGQTMQNVVESNLKEAFPDIVIELSQGVSDELIMMARDILKKRHNKESE